MVFDSCPVMQWYAPAPLNSDCPAVPHNALLVASWCLAYLNTRYPLASRSFDCWQRLPPAPIFPPGAGGALHCSSACVSEDLSTQKPSNCLQRSRSGVPPKMPHKRYHLEALFKVSLMVPSALLRHSSRSHFLPFESWKHPKVQPR